MNTCANCKFGSMFKNSESVLVMICRKKPPSVHAFPMPTGQNRVAWLTQTAWPAVADSDWCGDYQADIAIKS